MLLRGYSQQKNDFVMVSKVESTWLWYYRHFFFADTRGVAGKDSSGRRTAVMGISSQGSVGEHEQPTRLN